MRSGLNWNQIKNKTCYIPKVSKLSEEKRISMLTGLKELSLACTFYRPEHNAEEGGGGGEGRGDTVELDFKDLEM